MDTSDNLISFDGNGVCCHCHYFDKKILPIWKYRNGKGGELKKIIKKIKEKHIHKKYDVLIGLSGGVDSTYLAYFLRKNTNLRILAVHVDTGWNSPIAVKNIENIVKILKLDLITHVADWKEMKKLQQAFISSGVLNQDTPQDHVIFAATYKIAKQFNIKDYFVGYNIINESILPRNWQGLTAMDSRQIKDIYSIFKKEKILNLPILTYFENKIYYPRIYRLSKIPLLNYIDYDKEEARTIITKNLGWTDYGTKHGESNFTKVFQSVILPRRHNIDKRRAHLTSLILSGKISRSQALFEISQPVFRNKNEMEKEIEYFCTKLDLSIQQFHRFLETPEVPFFKYKNQERLTRFIRSFISLFKKF